MTNKSATFDKKDFESKINQTLNKLREGFTPSEWTEKEREEIKEELLEVEDLAKQILGKIGKS